jgi:dihydroorotate dehydrogenase (NAD+) catalytic subunit
MIDLSVDIAGIKMKNPIMPASGTFGYGDEYAAIEGFAINRLGALVTKGTSLLLRDGNPQPRIAEVKCGLINSIGLQNPGAREVAEKLCSLRHMLPVIVNVSGSSVEEYAEVIRHFEGLPFISGYELNISCPNVKQGGVAFGQNPKLATRVVSGARKVTSLPLIPKLTPNVTDIVVVAKAVVDAGADALSLINTLKGRGRVGGKREYLSGGYSGPGVMPVALRMVYDISCAKLGVPIIGEGGIQTAENVVEFFENGALAVQIGTETFRNPMAMFEIIDGLASYVERSGCKSLTEWREKGFPMPKEK